MLITKLDILIKKRYEKTRKMLSVSTKKDVFSKYLDIQSSAYKKILNKIASNIPNFGKTKRIFVLTPTFYEGENIVRTLNKLIPVGGSRLLKFWQKRVVFIILNNYLQTKPEVITTEFLKASIDNKDFKDIFVINYPLKTKQSRVGFFRKILHDIVIYKAQELKRPTNKFIFASFDGDILEADLRIFKKSFELLNANGNIDAVQGEMTRVTNNMSRRGSFYLFSVLYDELRNEWQSKLYRKNGIPKLNLMWNRVFTYGTNLFLKSKTYCEIGGFDNLVIGEDYAISAKISFLRAHCKDVLRCANTNSIVKMGYKAINHPRRDLHAFLKKVPVYKNFGRYDSEMRIREVGSRWQSVVSKLDKAAPINKKNIELMLNILLEKNKKRIFDSDAGKTIFKRAVHRALKKNNKVFSKKLQGIVYNCLNKILTND